MLGFMKSTGSEAHLERKSSEEGGLKPPTSTSL